MKRVFAAIGAVFAFAGIASLTLFFVMSPSSATGIADAVAGWASGGGANTNAGLTADIGGILSGGNGNGSNDGGADVTNSDISSAPGAAETTTPAIAASETAPVTPAEPSTTGDIAANGDASAAAPAAAPAPATSAVPDLPEATATITVTPTAPLPPGAGVQNTTGAGGGVALPYRQTDFADDARWQTTWGVASITNTGALSLSSGANSLGGAVHFTGGAWSNYSMSAAIDLVSGRTFSLAANYIDASDYVFCEYDEATAGAIDVQLKQDVQGYITAVSPIVTVPVSGGNGLVASIAVTGAYGTCSLNGATVSNDGAGAGKSALTAAQNGGIGFAVSDLVANASHIIVHDVNVAAK